MNDASTHRPVLETWFDLQCPDCFTALSDLAALRARYGERLEIRLRHLPLAKHKHAYAAAQAAEEAYAQGAGDAYAQALLERTAELGQNGEATLLAVAEQVGLDVGEVESSLFDGRHLLTVDADQAEAKALGITGTPTYVVRGERLDGGRSQDGLRERIETLIDQMLATR